MTIYRLAGAVLISVLSALGCATNLEIYQVAADQEELPNNVIPYALPRKAFVLTDTYVLRRCEAKKAEPLDELQFIVDETQSVVAINEVDPAHRYYVPYAKLASGWRDTEYTVETYENGTLKSFNTVTTDQVGPTVAATLGTLIRLGSAATSFSLLNLNDRSPSVPCKPEINQALKTVSDLSAKAAKAASEKTAPQIVDQDLLNYQSALKLLTFKQTTRWLPSVGNTTTSMSISMDALEAWMTGTGIVMFFGDGGPEQFRKVVELTVVDAGAPYRAKAADVAPTGKEPKPFAGLVLRQPLNATLRVCRGDCPSLTSQDATSVQNVLHTSDHPMPQLGKAFLLSNRNGINQSSSLFAVLSADGMITKLGRTQKNANAANITAFGANADALKAASDAERKARNDALTQAQNATKDANKLVADCLAAQKSIRDLGGVPIGTCQ